MLSSSLEKYLLTLYRMALSDKELKSSDLAKELNQSLQKTIQALQRMHYQKYIVYLPYQPLKITPLGYDMAKYLLARGKVVDEFLTFLQVTENKEEEKQVLEQYLTHQTLETIEKFILFVRQYPEISTRYQLLLKYPDIPSLLPPLPIQERP